MFKLFYLRGALKRNPRLSQLSWRSHSSSVWRCTSGYLRRSNSTRDGEARRHPTQLQRGTDWRAQAFLKDVEQSDGLPSSLFGSLPSIPDHCSRSEERRVGKECRSW